MGAEDRLFRFVRVRDARAVEHLRPVMGEVQVADVRAQVLLSLFSDFENFALFKPNAIHETSLATMLDQLVAWGEAMKTLRSQKSTPVIPQK